MSNLFWVVCIVAIVMTAETIKKIYEMRHEKRVEDDKDSDELVRLDQLEERIRVLERIVTEDKHDLRREINRL
jgi:hypothetical protein